MLLRALAVTVHAICKMVAADVLQYSIYFTMYLSSSYMLYLTLHDIETSS